MGENGTPPDASEKRKRGRVDALTKPPDHRYRTVHSNEQGRQTSSDNDRLLRHIHTPLTQSS